jgi:hypothetical protein
VFGLLGAASNTALLGSILAGGALGERYDPRALLNVTVALEAALAVAALILFRRRATGADC